MYRVSEAIRSTHNQDGGIVLDIQHGDMFSLNPVGSKILQGLQSGLDPSQIVDNISREFGVDRAVVERDCTEFLQFLEKHSLVRAADVVSA